LDSILEYIYLYFGFNYLRSFIVYPEAGTRSLTFLENSLTAFLSTKLAPLRLITAD